MSKPRKGIYKHCEWCNKEFYVSPCHARQKYCNADCMAASFRLPLKNCIVCNKEFKPTLSTQICCSRKCGHAYQEDRVTKTCDQCGKEYQVKQYRAETTRFCSQQCAGAWHCYTTQMRGANLKGNTYRKGLRPINAFTPEQVRGKNNPKWVEPLEFTCQQCGNKFYRKPNETRGYGQKNLFCSNQCRVTNFKENRAGENSPCWVGGIESYRGRDWKRVRILAVERDNGTCQRCGEYVGASIPVHHKRPFREFETHQEANELDNLICLCQPCHMKTEPRARREPHAHVQ